MVMGEIKDMLLKAYLKKGARPAGVPKIDKKVEPEFSAVKPPPPLKVETQKTVGDLTIAMQAQRIYNPGMPPAPPSAKPPAGGMLEQGVTPALDIKSKWDKGNE
jgi:hypothetical protein